MCNPTFLTFKMYMISNGFTTAGVTAGQCKFFVNYLFMPSCDLISFPHSHFSKDSNVFITLRLCIIHEHIMQWWSRYFNLAKISKSVYCKFSLREAKNYLDIMLKMRAFFK